MWFRRRNPSEQEQQATALRRAERAKLERKYEFLARRTDRCPRASSSTREEIDSYLRLGFTLDEVLEWAEQWGLCPLAVYAEKRVSDAYDAILSALEEM